MYYTTKNTRSKLLYVVFTLVPLTVQYSYVYELISQYETISYAVHMSSHIMPS